MPPSANPEAGAVTLFLCGDVMTGRGIDQILPHPGEPHLYEPYMRSAVRRSGTATSSSCRSTHDLDGNTGMTAVASIVLGSTATKVPHFSDIPVVLHTKLPVLVYR